MELLLTGTDAALAKPLLAALGRRHRVRTAAGPPAGDVHIAADLRDPQAAQRAVSGVDRIVHLAPLSPQLAAADDGDALDWLSRGTYNLLQAALDAGVQRVVQASTLDLFAAYPLDSRPASDWLPLPDTSLRQLAAYLMERSAREFALEGRLPVLLLRSGAVLTADEARREAATAVHRDDAVNAFVAAVEAPLTGEAPLWAVAHVLGADDPHFAPARPRLLPGFAPQQPAPRSQRPTARASGRRLTPRGWRRARREPWPGLEAAVRARGHERPRLALLGAGGPVLAATAAVIGRDAVLRLADIVSMAEAAANPQSEHAPVPGPVRAPHEEWRVDLSDGARVSEACRGMDVVVNGAVVRHEPAQAFRVNVSGCYHVLRAVVGAGIPRLVHTGPQLVSGFSSREYGHDVEVPADVPPRPGTDLYGHTKYLSFELCRIFAEEHDLTIPALLFNRLVDPQHDGPSSVLRPMAISWRDAGRAIWAAARVPDAALPAPYSPLLITADRPHGRFHNEAARRHLDWEPLDELADHWRGR